MRHVIMIEVLLTIAISAGVAQADIFAPTVVNNKDLREMLAKDSAGYYLHTGGMDYNYSVREISSDGAFTWPALKNNSSLYVTKRGFQEHFDEAQLDSSSQRPPESNGLLLLSYSSPAMADVAKHNRIFAIEQSAIDEAWLMNIQNAGDGYMDKLARLSLKRCLESSGDGSLPEALARCRKDEQPFADLKQYGGNQQGIGVVRLALSHLELNTTKIGKITDFTGDYKITANEIISVPPVRRSVWDDGTGWRHNVIDGEYAWLEDAQKGYAERMRALFSSHIAGAALDRKKADEVSFSGVPFTAFVLNGLAMLLETEREVAISRLASGAAHIKAELVYREHAGYLELAASDPALPAEFRGMVLDKKEAVLGELARLLSSRKSAAEYKEMLTELSRDGDVERARLAEETGPGVMTQSSMEDELKALLIKY